MALRSDWDGDSSLADSLEKIASDNNFLILYSKRKDKDQSYIKVSVLLRVLLDGTTKKCNLGPGINTELPDYANENGWNDGDKIRFREGYPEKNRWLG